jgi:hypothetical protein
MSFGQFISSKVLGSHLTLTNKSDKEQIFEVSVSKQLSFNESTKELLNDYVESELPFKPATVGPTANSEPKHGCLFIENPKTKNLEKAVTIKLAGKASIQFVVVVKAPRIKKLDFVSAL